MLDICWREGKEEGEGWGKNESGLIQGMENN